MRSSVLLCAVLCGVFLHTLGPATATGTAAHAVNTTEYNDSDLFASWFADQRQEVHELTPLPVEGIIPSYVQGGLYRVGPAISNPGLKNYTNFLDAFGRISQWRIDGTANTVTFNSRIIKSHVFNVSLTGDDFDPYAQFGITRHITSEPTSPKTNPGVCDLEAMDNTDVNVYQWKSGPNVGKIISMTDFYIMNQMDAGSLVQLDQLHSKAADENAAGGGDGEYFPTGVGGFSGSHPVEWLCPVDGKIYLVNWLGEKTAGGTDIYGYLQGEDNRRHVVGKVSLDFLPYSIHSIAVAGNVLSIFVGSIGLEFMSTAMNLCISCSVKDQMATKPATVYVFDLLAAYKVLDSKEAANMKPLAQIEIDPTAPGVKPTFLFHHINARSFIAESNGNGGHSMLQLDICAYESTDGFLGKHVLGDLDDIRSPEVRDSMASGCTAVRRLLLDITTHKLVSMLDLPLRDIEGNTYTTELASVRPDLWGKEACFMYSMAYHYAGSPRMEDMGILKTDLCAAASAAAAAAAQSSDSGSLANGGATAVATVTAAFHEDNVYVGEPLFVANPEGVDEDDGVVLVVSKDAIAQKTRLLILDAKTLVKVASVTSTFATMFEFHGQFFAD